MALPQAFVEWRRRFQGLRCRFRSFVPRSLVHAPRLVRGACRLYGPLPRRQQLGRFHGGREDCVCTGVRRRLAMRSLRENHLERTIVRTSVAQLC